jgi:chromosome segregation ATPase
MATKKATLPNLTEAQIADLMQEEAEELKQQVEAWAAQETKPLHDRMTAIDAEIAALQAEKRDCHTQVDAIEAESAKQRYAFRGPDAGPDQVLAVAGGISEQDVAAMRQLVEQYDRQN